VVRLSQQDAGLPAVRDRKRSLGAGGASADYDEVVVVVCFAGPRTFQGSS
jgi:hypothetical protein